MDFNNTFEYDLNIGQKYERKFAGMLEGKIEIKTDRIAHNTDVTAALAIILQYFEQNHGKK
jgi:hypothetical protein